MMPLVESLGLSKFNPRAERLGNRPLPIYLSRVQVAGEEQPLSATGATRVPEFELPAARNNLLIEYVALSFQGEQKLRYQYKLDGVDADWSAPGEGRSVNYAWLAPGTYQFLARAINEEGLLSPEPAALQFRILPPLLRRVADDFFTADDHRMTEWLSLISETSRAVITISQREYRRPV